MFASIDRSAYTIRKSKFSAMSQRTWKEKVGEQLRMEGSFVTMEEVAKAFGYTSYTQG